MSKTKDVWNSLSRLEVASIVAAPVITWAMLATAQQAFTPTVAKQASLRQTAGQLSRFAHEVNDVSLIAALENGETYMGPKASRHVDDCINRWVVPNSRRVGLAEDGRQPAVLASINEVGVASCTLSEAHVMVRSANPKKDEAFYDYFKPLFAAVMGIGVLGVSVGNASRRRANSASKPA